jgi:hypothetical protein
MDVNGNYQALLPNGHAFCATQRLPFIPGGHNQRLPRELHQCRWLFQIIEPAATRTRTVIAYLQTLMPTFKDPRAVVIGCRTAAMPFPFRLLFALACEAFRTRVLIIGRFRLTIV